MKHADSHVYHTSETQTTARLNSLNDVIRGRGDEVGALGVGCVGGSGLVSGTRQHRRHPGGQRDVSGAVCAQQNIVSLNSDVWRKTSSPLAQKISDGETLVLHQSM